MFLAFSRISTPRLYISINTITMPSRTSPRQAAVKANQAFTQGAGTKRKASSSSQVLSKKEKPNERSDYQKPSVTEDAENEQRIVAPTENIEEPVKDDGVKKEEEEVKKDLNGKHSRQNQRVQSLMISASGNPESSQTAIKVSSERENVLPSSIFEKGIIYFFFRPRVNVEDPHTMEDVARSFFVLRPIPKGARLEDGPIGDDNNCRLMMLPKKKYPSSGRERDMGFVEKAQISLKTLREKFMEKGTYETKTRGERTTPEARPYAEGVYALIKEGRNSHLAYILTIPRQLGDIQRDFGLHSRGSFVIQSKNPDYPGPPNARLPHGPEYPEKVQERFKGYRWIPTEPEFLDYPNAQFLVIGSAQDQLGKAGETHIDDKGTKEDPAEELNQLEGENVERILSLSGDHSIFDDLGIDAKKYESFLVTWE